MVSWKFGMVSWKGKISKQKNRNVILENDKPMNGKHLIIILENEIPEN